VGGGDADGGRNCSSTAKVTSQLEEKKNPGRVNRKLGAKGEDRFLWGREILVKKAGGIGGGGNCRGAVTSGLGVWEGSLFPRTQHTNGGKGSKEGSGATAPQPLRWGGCPTSVSPKVPSRMEKANWQLNDQLRSSGKKNKFKGGGD